MFHLKENERKETKLKEKRVKERKRKRNKIHLVVQYRKEINKENLRKNEKEM